MLPFKICRVPVDEPRNDAVVQAFFPRELEEISQEVFTREYAEFKAREFFPVDHSIGAGKTLFTWREWDRVGAAVVMADYSTAIPRADAFGTENSSKIRPLVLAYGISIEEIEAAAAEGRALDRMRAEACREGFEQTVDDIAAVGDAANGLVGVLNQPNIPSYTIPNGASGHTDWARKTPDEIIADCNGIGSYIFKLTLEREKPDTLLLPTAQYSLIQGTPRQTFSDKTILDFLIANSPWFKNIDSWTKLTGAGASSTDRMLAYTRDPRKIRQIIPQEQTPLPPQPEGMEIVTITKGRHGGVVMFKPLSAAYGDGI